MYFSYSVRGRLCSIFNLILNFGVLTGFIISSYVPYHVIPCAVVILPILYLLLTTRFPETPQQLLRWERDEAAQQSLMYYRNCDGPAPSKESVSGFQKAFDEMRLAIQQQLADQNKEGLTIADFCKQQIRFSGLYGSLYLIPFDGFVR